jgi:catechol 2,3-dioxygenase-like lactoylglutathione lyase family enzyme
MTARPTALRLDRISRNVGDLAAATAFYTEALGFNAQPSREADPALAALFGVRALRLVLLQRGRQRLELSACDPPGAHYPPGSRSDDLWFQHCALVTDDIGAAHDRLLRTRYTPISRHGPQALPGGHPLELIQFAKPDPRTRAGIDHSAICVADPERSLTFYGARLGLVARTRQVNSGAPQEALDDLDGVSVEVVGLAPTIPAPHLELLGYRAPLGRTNRMASAADIAASRLVFAMTAPDPGEDAISLQDGTRVSLIHDPDGHALMLEHRP